MDLIRELNYSFNADFFRIAFAMKASSFNRDERNKIASWVRKIMKNNKTLNDLKLRNAFIQFLVQNVQNGKLEAPFNQDPPMTALKALAKQLPGKDEVPAQDDEAIAMLRFLPAKNGGFLLPKPLPQIGAYCYISAMSKGDCSKKCTLE